MRKPEQLLGTMRPPFLTLPPVCVALGWGAAMWTHHHVNYLHLLLALIGGMAAHIAVNVLNEYHDFRSGLDSRTVRTPFSGGSGTLQKRPDLGRQTLVLGWASVVITALVGLYFLYVRGLGLLPLGLAGLVTIVAYTVWLTRRPLLCLIAPGLGFGTFMVMGTSYVLTGSYTWTSFIASLVPFFLVSNLLLLNQFPDVDADRTIGRRHLPIAAGRRASSLVFAGFYAMTYLSIIAGVLFDLLPLAGLLGLLTIAVAIPAALGAVRNADNPVKLVPFMGMNVVINLATPVLVAAGLLIG